MPHQTTLQRAFRHVEPADVTTARGHICAPVVPGAIRARGAHGVAVDGKAQRGRLRHAATPTHPVHAVRAFCPERGGVRVQCVVDGEQHEAELSVAPEVIKQLDWPGRVLTGDALYCQQALCQQVGEAGGDYRVIVKANQPTLLHDIMHSFTPLTAEEQARRGVHTVQPLVIHTHCTVEKGHGRIEERQMRVSSERKGYHDWPSVAHVFELPRTWTSNGVTKQQVRYGITSLPEQVRDGARLAALKRGLWHVENALHSVKDVT